MSQTCWKKTIMASFGGGGIIFDGIDYTQVKVIMDTVFKDSNHSELLTKLMVMESKAVEILNKS